MTNLTLTPDTLVLDLGRADRLLSLHLRSTLSVPLTSITDAHVDDEARVDWKRALKAPGTHVPGVVAAGTFYEEGRRVFANLREGQPALVLRLRGEHYDEIVVRTDDVHADLARVLAAIEEVNA
ncbi:hypothetical protein [Deinococcus pimensis]|uniref:hypothetical protein n=1 Tax=Deinococcus pimensis TaxID=309888 RepID=UPI0004B1892F|nr:hypothetical protein [Deinococcus pimensis]